ncbi:hypothetical protein Srot_1103 [Segniliparus rotundus DSM 44985]|uniref:Transmembrane protein n=1 Tax=Segniliparus rotundus (strain ATCC BAA-972 / CDC 1076 / CIP 108378 / DSM 44985 / JCM 13578) TaxID=640132 RepID=D6ZF52_SEGRD|nr:hypothetical protein [Segniliparus rotundus]ADG97576.1 hypothetical protein Srot_1103 [Segniliparus rotundus DSM 44985]
MVGTTAEMIAEDLRRYGEDETAEWVLSCSDDDLVQVCSVASWVYGSGVMLATACALAAVYVRERAPRELSRKRRKPSTVAEGPLLQNGRRPSRAADERAGRHYPFYGVGEDAIEFWRPQEEHKRWRQRRKEVLRHAQERNGQTGLDGFEG